MGKDRRKKEFGVKIYEFGLHILSIISLYMLLDTLGFLINSGFSLFGYSPLWWLWLTFLLYLGLRLYILDVLRKKARKRGMLLTKYVELINRRGRF